MTTTVTVNVGGNYRSKVTTITHGENAQPNKDEFVGPNEQRSFSVPHNFKTTTQLVIGPEEYLGETPSANPEPTTESSE